MYSVTDSTSAAGMPDGEYQLGTHRVFKKDDVVRLSDGTLAGSAATAEVTVNTLRQFGLEWPEISNDNDKYATCIVARLDEPGAIIRGNMSDFVTFRGQTLESVWIDGQPIIEV